MRYFDSERTDAQGPDKTLSSAAAKAARQEIAVVEEILAVGKKKYTMHFEKKTTWIFYRTMCGSKSSTILIRKSCLVSLGSQKRWRVSSRSFFCEIRAQLSKLHEFDHLRAPPKSKNTPFVRGNGHDQPKPILEVQMPHMR